MARTPIKITLKGGNWDVLNPIINNSSELDTLMDSKMEKIEAKIKKNILSTGHSRAKWIAANVRSEVKPPNNQTKIKVRFISAPNAGFEFRFGSIKKALDG